MKPPRVTVRRLILLVAMAGPLSLALAHRANGMRRDAALHAALSGMAAQEPRAYEWGSTGAKGRARFHDRMRAKYERAARLPWLPVEADPPYPTMLPMRVWE